MGSKSIKEKTIWELISGANQRECKKFINCYGKQIRKFRQFCGMRSFWESTIKGTEMAPVVLRGAKAGGALCKLLWHIFILGVLSTFFYGVSSMYIFQPVFSIISMQMSTTIRLFLAEISHTATEVEYSNIDNNKI